MTDLGDAKRAGIMVVMRVLGNKPAHELTKTLREARDKYGHKDTFAIISDLTQVSLYPLGTRGACSVLDMVRMKAASTLLPFTGQQEP